MSSVRLTRSGSRMIAGEMELTSFQVNCLAHFVHSRHNDTDVVFLELEDFS